MRIWFYAEAVQLFNAHEPNAWSSLRVLTLVHEGWIIPDSQIACFNPTLLVDRVRHQFLRAETTGAIVIGAIHGEYDKQRQYWQPHLHLIAQGLSEKSEKLIRHRHYRPSAYVSRPMVVQPLENPARQVSYLLKSYWPMRIRYIDAYGEERSSFQRIAEPYQAAYLVMLNRFNLLDFVLLIGVRRNGHVLKALGT
jgi:hypothetical protein